MPGQVDTAPVLLSMPNDCRVRLRLVYPELSMSKAGVKMLSQSEPRRTLRHGTSDIAGNWYPLPG